MTQPADAPLQQQVRAVFEADGVLSRTTAHFRPRQGQIDMAVAVARTIERGGALVVEAGTGVGKTFSYLVPALLSGERVLLSTATKTLQDQLFGRDLPTLVAALGMPVRTALLKGRSSYLCLHRMQQARHALDTDAHRSLRSLADVERWAPLTRTGDLAEVESLDERSPLLPLISSTRDNCLGAQCPQLRSCHVNLARREAMAADVVVVNHHLFFADLAVRESGMAELLPTVRVAIFDEAHQLNETGVQFLGTQMGSGQLLDFARDVLSTGLQQAQGLADWHGCVRALEHAARDLRMLAGPVAAGTRLRWLGLAPDGLDERDWSDCMAAVLQALQAAVGHLQTVTELAPDFVRLHERALTLLERSTRFAGPGDGQAVRWADVGLQLRLIESPLDIAQAVQTRLLQGDGGADAAGDGRAWIFTSATLGDDARLRWFTEPCGLTEAEVLRVDSPFDYATQAALYVPLSLPKPADPGHSAAVAALVADAALRIGGRTLVLTTTLRALRTIGAALKAQVGAELDVLVQGEGTKRRLMERLRDGADPGGRGCILVASVSFWEGVDVPGDALQLVCIDKLPFPPPGDPLVEARTQRIEQEGGNPFKDYFIAETAVALKQGAGRLIRRESDRGVLVVCDTRLVQMGYGRRLRAALPAMRQIKDAPDFQQTLAALATRPSTMANPSA